MNLLLLLLTIYTINLVVEAHRRAFNPHPTSDTLLLTRCHLKCSNKSSSACNVSDCIENISKLTKFGKCPERPKNCNQLDYCSKKDYNCPGTQKCCTYSCGDFCQDPRELDLIEGLPTIPINFTVSQKGVRIISVSWDMINLTTPILYVVETRAHIGAVFSEYKLSDWRYIEVQHEYDKQFKDIVNHRNVIRPVGSIRLRPGRWYEFRIAAVNENGTRGYSNHTKAFQLKEKPKSPRSPKKLQFGSFHQSLNSTVDTTIYWNVPRSDLPIEKYKLNWSLYLEGRTPSLLMEHAFVSEPFFHLKNLLPNSLYYIQVQSISSFGRKRLKSPKLNELLNTTISEKILHSDKQLVNKTRQDNMGVNSPQRIYKRLPGRKLTINFVPDNFNGITVKISWRDKIGESFIDLCPGDDSCFNRRLTNEFSSARIKKNYFQFSNLKYNRQYTIRLRHYNKKILISSTFMTPSCTNLQRKYPNTLLKC